VLAERAARGCSVRASCSSSMARMVAGMAGF
jgi:hypothetical protein